MFVKSHLRLRNKLLVTQVTEFSSVMAPLIKIPLSFM